jgi:hypothetical protein
VEGSWGCIQADVDYAIKECVPVSGIDVKKKRFHGDISFHIFE